MKIISQNVDFIFQAMLLFCFMNSKIDIKRGNLEKSFFSQSNKNAANFLIVFVEDKKVFFNE